MYERVVKRGIDILLSSVALVVFSWLYLIIALAIKIDDPGPAFFVQKRVGKGKKLFDKRADIAAKDAIRPFCVALL